MKIPKEIDGVLITKPYGLRERSYIKGWEARQGEIKKLEDEIFQYNEELSDARTEIEVLREYLKIIKFDSDQALTGKE